MDMEFDERWQDLPTTIFSEEIFPRLPVEKQVGIASICKSLVREYPCLLSFPCGGSEAWMIKVVPVEYLLGGRVFISNLKAADAVEDKSPPNLYRAVTHEYPPPIQDEDYRFEISAEGEEPEPAEGPVVCCETPVVHLNSPLIWVDMGVVFPTESFRRVVPMHTAGGLIAFKALVSDDRDTCNEESFIICNPLTKRLRLLPALPEPHEEDVDDRFDVTLSVDKDGGYYKFYVPYANKVYIYHSSDRIWRCFYWSSYPPEFISSNVVEKHGYLWFVCRDIEDIDNFQINYYGRYYGLPIDNKASSKKIKFNDDFEVPFRVGFPNFRIKIESKGLINFIGAPDEFAENEIKGAIVCIWQGDGNPINSTELDEGCNPINSTELDEGCNVCHSSLRVILSLHRIGSEEFIEYLQDCGDGYVCVYTDDGYGYTHECRMMICIRDKGILNDMETRDRFEIINFAVEENVRPIVFCPSWQKV